MTFSAAMESQTPGKGQAYLSAYTDAGGNWLDGGAGLPLEPYFDRSWKLGDIQPAGPPQPPRPRRGPTYSNCFLVIPGYTRNVKTAIPFLTKSTSRQRAGRPSWASAGPSSSPGLPAGT